MHIEILTEDRSGMVLLENILPKIIGPYDSPHTWRLHSYKGLGRIPKKLKPSQDPAKRILLQQLPKLLSGYSKTPDIGAVIIILDTDSRDCKTFLTELKQLAQKQRAAQLTTFRLAIEEVESWYFGDRKALLSGYPRAKKSVLDSYIQDSICGTWEFLADAIHPGGAATVKKAGWPLPGQLKHQWAEKIGPHMDVEANQSPSFAKLRDGLRKIVQYKT